MPNDVSKELQELFDAAGPPEAPSDLGNFPGEARAEAPEAPAPVEAPTADAPEPQADPEPAAPADPVQARIAELEAQLEDARRESEFVRAGQQATAIQSQAPPIPQLSPDTILPFAFSQSDLESMGMNATPENVERINNAFRLVALSGANAAEQRLRAEYQQVQAVQQSGQTLRQAFYSANPDLEPYADVVGVYATQVHQQNPQAPAAALMAETARRARERLAQMGVAPGQAAPAPKQPAARPRLKPAAAEGGASTRGNGATKLSAVEKDILQMMQAG